MSASDVVLEARPWPRGASRPIFMVLALASGPMALALAPVALALASKVQALALRAALKVYSGQKNELAKTILAV